MDNFVLNLTDKILTEDQINVLSKGLNFCPTPKDTNPVDLRFDLDSLQRRLRLHSHFKDEEDHPSTPFSLDKLDSCKTFVICFWGLWTSRTMGKRMETFRDIWGRSCPMYSTSDVQTLPDTSTKSSSE